MRTHRFFLGLALVATVGCKKREQSGAGTQTPAVGDSFAVVAAFRTPESVLHDSVADVYLVSNIYGAAGAKDDNGFISRVAPDGRVLDLNWVDGASDAVTLNAPKGLGIRGDTLFVADIDQVRLFHRTSGASLGAWPVSGAAFLNDIAVGPDGTVYVTDTGSGPNDSASAVYRFDAGGNAAPLAHGAELAGPNGVWANANGLVVVTWTGDAYYLDAQGRRTPMPRPPHGRLDGVIQVPNGWTVVSSWEDSSLFRISAGETTWTKLRGGLVSPADIGYDARRGRLLIPLFQLHRVEVRPLH